MLERMMDGLMSKDVLYEPMRDLAEKVRPPPPQTSLSLSLTRKKSQSC